MFFKAAQRGNNNFLLYILMFIVIFLTQVIGSIPFVLEALKYPEIMQTGDLFEVLKLVPNKNYALLLVALPFVFTFVFFALLTKPIFKKSLKDWLTGAPKFRWNQFFFAFGVVAIFVAGTIFYEYTISPEDYVVQFELQSFLTMFLIVIFFITIQASTEELIFRGWLAQGVGLLTKSRFLALIIPTVLFGLLHISNPEVAEHGLAVMLPLYMTMGLSFGIITLMNDGAELAMGYHGANNIMLSLLVSSPESVLQTNAILKMKDAQEVDGQLISMIVSQVIIIGIFAWKYKWTDWKGKLFGSINKETQTIL